MGTLVRSLALVILFLVAFHQIDKSSFIDRWTPGLEEALLHENFSRLYMDGPRPFFIQKSHPNAKVFYDLNPRFRSADDLSNICKIKACLDPEVWVFGDHLKSRQMLELLANQFETIVDQRKSFVVAKQPKLACDPRPPTCDDLLMYK